MPLPMNSMVIDENDNQKFVSWIENVLLIFAQREVLHTDKNIFYDSYYIYS